MPKEKVSKPNEAARLIFEIVDLLPPGLKLPDFATVLEVLCLRDSDGHIAKYNDRFGNQSDEEINRLVTEEGHFGLIEEVVEKEKARACYRAKALDECLSGLPAKFVDYVNSGVPRRKVTATELMEHQGITDDDNQTLTFRMLTHPVFSEGLPFSSKTGYAQHKYEHASSCYTRLYAMAEYLTNLARRKNKFFEFDYESKVFRISRFIVKDNKIAFEPDEFTQAFTGVGIERIRLCDKCGRVFWASRHDMKGCTRSCAKILRTRKWREKVTPEQKQSYYADRILREIKKGEN